MLIQWEKVPAIIFPAQPDSLGKKKQNSPKMWSAKLTACKVRPCEVRMWKLISVSKQPPKMDIVYNANENVTNQ